MTPWCCPLCPGSSHELILGGGSYRCEAGHCFDVARESYVNLLPVQQKKSRSPGDSAESLQARRQFLAAGFYQPLRDALVALLARPASSDADAEPPSRTIIDLGCGEGYYSAAMTAVASEVIALDIAKPAIRLAAKTYPQLRCAVASVAAVPLPSACADVITSIFAPVPLAQMQRLLKPGGQAVVVTPAPAHLFAYRHALFGEVRDHVPAKFADAASAQFTVQAQTEVRYDIVLDHAAINALLPMTPYAYKASPERRRAVSEQSILHTEAAFSVLVLTKPLLDLDDD